MISKLFYIFVEKYLEISVNMNYQQTLEWLYNRFPAFQKVGANAYKPGLDRVIELLEKLGNPHRKYKVVHVGGTNGKGSTSNMLASVLQSAGYKVGLYTSPHLVDFGERIRINGDMIEEDFVTCFVKENRELLDRIDPSFFEITMAMAFQYFADCTIDVAIVEVGLGGRLDSTNVVLPEFSVITNIGYDHTQFLGNTLPQIAKEKAGIIKQGIPVVIGEKNDEINNLFIEESKNKNAPIVFAEDVSLDVEKKNNIFSLKIGNTVVVPELQSDFQQKNIQTLMATIPLLVKSGFVISERALKKGLENVTKNTHFQGRWQVVQQKPKIIVDTAHNSHGMRFVIKELEKEQYDRLFVLLGMVQDKDVEKVLDFLPKKATYFFTSPNTKRAIPSCDLAKIAYKKGLKGDLYPNSQKAFSAVSSILKDDDLLLVIGSNYLVGEIIPLIEK